MNANLDQLLRSALLDEAEQAMTLTDTAAAHDRLQARLSRGTRRRRAHLTIAVAAASVVAVVAAVALTGGDGSARPQPVVPATQAPSVVTVEKSVWLPSAAILSTGIVRGITAHLGYNPAVAGGSLWTISPSGKALLRIDPATARQQASVPLHLPPGMLAEQVTAAGSHLVVTAALVDHAVEGLPKTNAAFLVIDASRGVQTASVPALLDFGQEATRAASGPAGTWVQSGPQELGLLDLRAGRITRRLPVGQPMNGFAVSSTAVWVASFSNGLALRVDVATGAVTSRWIGYGMFSAGSIDDDGLFWRFGLLMRVAGAPPEVRATLALPASGGGGKADLVSDGARVFCVCGVRGQLVVMDPSLRSAKVYDVPNSEVHTSIAYGDSAVWLQLRDGTLLALDPDKL